jgi:hypothetical protein
MVADDSRIEGRGSVGAVLASRDGRAGGICHRTAAFLDHDREEHSHAANEASDEADDDLAIPKVKSVRHHEKSEQIESYSHYDSRGIALQLLKHCPPPG